MTSAVRMYLVSSRCVHILPSYVLLLECSLIGRVKNGYRLSLTATDSHPSRNCILHASRVGCMLETRVQKKF
jgi:hypothetical protein